MLALRVSTKKRNRMLYLNQQTIKEIASKISLDKRIIFIPKTQQIFKIKI